MLLLAIVALSVPLALNLSARVTAEARTQAQAQADLVAATAADLLGRSQRRELAVLAQTAGRSTRGRILIVDARGGVLVDSAGPAQVGSSYESRPEIQAALRGRQVQVARSSRTLHTDILATAVPIIRHGRPVGAVRVTQDIAAVHRAVRRAELGLILIGLIVLGLGLLAGVLIARHVGQPIGRLEQVARRVAHGDLTARAQLEGSREQRSLARSFNEMTERIVRLLTAQQQFVADASHQLRTPLTGLRLRLEEARAAAAPENGLSDLDAAIAELDRLSATVDELLVLSRGGERPVSSTTLDLVDLAEAAVSRWRRAADERGIRVEHIREGDQAMAMGIRPDVERALDSLIENGINYSPSGTTVSVVSASARLEVRDRGPGVDPDEREQLFLRFRRGKAGLAGPSGSGLGLAIARELARGSGGEVTIESREGGGAVATLRLPAQSFQGANADGDALPALNLRSRSLT